MSPKPITRRPPRARRPAPRDPATLSAADDPNDWLLDGRPFDAGVAELITGGTVKSTIEAASTLTLELRDSERQLLRPRRDQRARSKRVKATLFGEAVRLDAIGLEWSLAAVSKTGDDLELVFENLAVAELRRHDKPRKVARDKKTRAEFLKLLVDEVDEPDIVFVSPELHKRQPIARSRDQRNPVEREERRERGIVQGARLEGKEGALSAGQLRNAERALDVAESIGALPRAVLALLLACIVEAPDFTNPAGGEGSSAGMLQLTADKLGGSTSSDGGRRDVELVCHLFLTEGFTGAGGANELARKNPDMTPGEIAQTVQGSAHPSRYQQYIEQARAIYDAYGGMSGDLVSTIAEAKRYEFSRGRPGGPEGEDTWQCSLRLADEVGWRRFMVRNRFYYAAEEDLIRSKPRMTISEEMAGVDWIDFDIDGRHKVDEATVHCRAGVWACPPGAVVVVEDLELANGRWLVSEIERPLFSTASEVSLRRGAALLKEQREPAPELVTRQVRTGGGGPQIQIGDGRQAKARAIYEAARRISDQKRSYEYGGGHGPALSSLVGGGDLDCSSSTSLALWMAGQFDDDVAWVSGTFAAQYGQPGPGEFVTVWAHSGHVWIEFNLPGAEDARFDTSQHNESGPRLVNSARSTAGFTARHPS